MSDDKEVSPKNNQDDKEPGRFRRLINSDDSLLYRPPSQESNSDQKGPNPSTAGQPEEPAKLEEASGPKNELIDSPVDPQPENQNQEQLKSEPAPDKADEPPTDITGGWFINTEDPELPHAPSFQKPEPLSQDEKPVTSSDLSKKKPTEPPPVPPFLEKRIVAPLDQSTEVTPPSGTRIHPLKLSDTKASDAKASDSGATRARPMSGNETTLPPPMVDKNGMPLPRRVSEVDMNATRVTPAAYGSSGQTPTRMRQTPYNTGRISPAPTRAEQKASIKQTQPIKASLSGWRRGLGCLLRVMIALIFIGILAAIAVGSFAIYQYYVIAATLPDVGGLRASASQFETTRILDRNGNTLYEILDPNAGKRTYEPLSKISPYLVAATIATEDKNFYTNPGFDPFAIARALWQNYASGGTYNPGASTITQQLARALLLTPEERSQITIDRKEREIILAAEITRRYSKDDILELYFNEIYYGNLAYGIEAAAETYFNTSADKLDLAQSAFLAGLPQAPSVYDIYTNRDQTLTRQKSVLVLMYNDSQDQNCISVSNSVSPVCVDAVATAQAANEMDTYTFTQSPETMRYPHWVNYIRSLLEAQYDSQTIYRSGFTVYTTLDPGLQDEAEKIVKNQVVSLTNLKVSDGALVAIKPTTGEILAMVGSADYNDVASSGQVNMAISPTRQPGSSIKPLTYVLAFEKGWTPSTLVWDVPSEFPPSGDPTDPRPPYVPVNYDGQFFGPLSVRLALANSRNIPAVKTLSFVGIYDDPKTPGQQGLVSFAKKFGITTLTRNDYGLALTLGGGEVSLLEMTSAYTVFANEGLRIPAVAITKIVDHSGNVVFNYTPPPGDQVIRPEHAFLITSILSDPNARAADFGTHSVLNLPFPAAVKTGTTNDFRDNWTIGYTPDITVGVWVGNANYTPMLNTTGLTGAAPIWGQFMQIAIQQLTGGNPTPFSKPPGIVEKVVCSVSGTEPSQWCPDQKSEFFAADQLPPTKDNDLWQNVLIDTWTGYKASADCSGYTVQKFAANVSDPWAQKWILTNPQGQAWAKKMAFTSPIFFSPQQTCNASDPHPNISFANITEGQTITTNPFEIYGVADASSDFDYFRLDYDTGDNPGSWTTLVDHVTAPVKQTDKLYTWDISKLPPGEITLRIWVHSTHDTYAEKRIHLNLQVPTPTPTMTPTPTVTITPSLTPTHTPSPVPTNTPAPSNTSPPLSTVVVQPPTETPVTTGVSK